MVKLFRLLFLFVAVTINNLLRRLEDLVEATAKLQEKIDANDREIAGLMEKIKNT